MVINHKPEEPKPIGPSKGDKRVVNYFAFLSIRIGNESRWLERVTISQEYNCGSVPICTQYYWIDKKFMEKC